MNKTWKAGDTAWFWYHDGDEASLVRLLHYTDSHAPQYGWTIEVLTGPKAGTCDHHVDESRFDTKPEFSTPLLDSLRAESIFSAEVDGGVVRFTEECDKHFQLEMTPDQVIALATELLQLADEAAQGCIGNAAAPPDYDPSKAAAVLDSLFPDRFEWPPSLTTPTA